MHKAFEAALDEDLRPFVETVRALGIAVRASEESSHQAVWADTADEARWVAGLWQRHCAGDFPLQGRPAAVLPAMPLPPAGPAPASYPVTLLLMLAAALVFVMVWLLQDARWLAALSFEPLQLQDGRAVRGLGLEAGLQAGQYWRLFTPMLLHFGILHIVFNILWLWEFGRRIESRRGSLHFLVLVAVTAVASNASQYQAQQWTAEPGLFGGLSGVIYALVGYIGSWNALRPAERYDVPRGLFVVMLGFLLLCMTGIMTLAGFGRIANAAHVGGLLAGVVAGAVAVVLTGRRHGH